MIYLLKFANTSHSNYTPEVLFCGGSTIDDSLPPEDLSSQTPASNQCARMVLNADGISAGWQVETMPGNRLMTDAIIMPDGNVLFINGVATGVSAFSTSISLVPFYLNHVVANYRWLVIRMFPTRSVNRMRTTQAGAVFSFYYIS